MEKKRKYTRKVIPGAVQSKSSTVEEGVSTIPHVDEKTGEILQSSKDFKFSFSDLPSSIQGQVEAIIKMRKGLGLPDDSKERKERAIRMYRGDRPH